MVARPLPEAPPAGTAPQGSAIPQPPQRQRAARDAHCLLAGIESLAGAAAIGADPRFLISAKGRAQFAHHRRVAPDDARGDALSVPLYSERSILVGAKDGVAVPEHPDWHDIAALPLCLLHQGMQNRRILDARFAALGFALRPVVTADSYVALLAIVRQGQLCSIMPDSHAMLLGGLDWARSIPLPDTGEPNRIGVIISDRAPMSPLAQSVLAVARDLRLPDGYRTP